MDKQIFFKRIEEAQIEGVWQLINLLKEEQVEVSFTDLETVSEVAQWVNNPAHLVYVAVDEAGEVLAVVRGKRNMSPEYVHAVFLTAATHPKARGKKIAADLTLYALEEMKSVGVTIARIYVFSDNKSSLRAVAKLGFEHSGTVHRLKKSPKTGEFIDDLIFHKFLD